MRLRDDLAFEDWVAHNFDHPSDGLMLQWYFEPDSPWWDADANPQRAVEYVNRLFEHIADFTAPYTDAQVDQGLWYILDNGGSASLNPLNNPRVDWPLRQRCVQSFYTVYADLYAPTCDPRLGHRSEPGNPLNMTCYMWYDIIPLQADLHPEFIPTLIDVLERTLQLDNIACQEGALHGFGHWGRFAPQQTDRIISTFLKNNPHLREELRVYAHSANGGCVL